MNIRILNTAQPQQAPEPATRPDGTLFLLEMIYDGGRWRGYADTHEELLEQLIDGYTGLATDDDRLQARIRLAVDAQVAVQAQVADDAALNRCSDIERRVLLGPRDTPPRLERWDAEIPLVLVTSFYAPLGPHPQPAEGAGQIWWLDPSTAPTLLEGLHTVGWLQLSQLGPSAATTGNAD